MYYLSDHDECTPGHLCCDCGAVATDAIEIEFDTGGRLWSTYCEEHARAFINRLHKATVAEMDRQGEEEGESQWDLVAVLIEDSKSPSALREEELCGMVKE